MTEKEKQERINMLTALMLSPAGSDDVLYKLYDKHFSKLLKIEPDGVTGTQWEGIKGEKFPEIDGPSRTEKI